MKNLLLLLSSQKADYVQFERDGCYGIRTVKNSINNLNLYAMNGSLRVENAANGWTITDKFYYCEKDGKCRILHNNGKILAEYKRVFETASSKDGKFVVLYLQEEAMTDLFDAEGCPLLEKKEKIFLLPNGWYWYQNFGEKSGILIREDGSKYPEEVIYISEWYHGWFCIITEKGKILCRENGQPVSGYVEDCGVYSGSNWYYLKQDGKYHLHRVDGSKVDVFDSCPDVHENGMFTVQNGDKTFLYDDQNIFIDSALVIMVDKENDWYYKESNAKEHFLCRRDRSVIVQKNDQIESLCGKLYQYVDENGNTLTCREDGTVLAEKGGYRVFSNGMYWREQDFCFYDKGGRKLLENVNIGRYYIASLKNFLLVPKGDKIFVVGEAEELLPILKEALEGVGDEITEEQFLYFLEYFRFFNLMPGNGYLGLLKSLLKI